MQPGKAYTSPTPESNSQPAFELTPYVHRHRKHLVEEITAALGAILPWQRPLAWRMARTWNTWRGGTQGAHAKKRWARETRLRANLDLLTRRNWYCRLTEDPSRYRISARQVILLARRLTNAGDWWKPKAYVVPDTGELRETTYLPEDTWGAAHLLDWCVSFLERLHRAVASMTERTTRPYKPREAETVRRGHGGPSRIGWDVKAAFRGLAERYGGPQLPLPTT